MANKITSFESNQEADNRQNFLNLFKEAPIPQSELLCNLGLFMKRQDLSRVLFMHELYKRIIDVPGIIVEFGVRWGQNLALFENFRGIYEPYNHNRNIVGFDTFKGFPSVHEKDGKSEIAVKGNLAVTQDYEKFLEPLLTCHEKENPISHMKKFELVVGDASLQIDRFLKERPETIIALAYFDFDIYEPTKKCLEAIRPHLTKGSVIGFDELNVRDFPGETLALKEIWGLDRFRLMRSPFGSVQSFLIVD